MTQLDGRLHQGQGPGRGRVAALFARYSALFTRYSAMSVLTVVAGSTLFLLARRVWSVNAGLLNVGVAVVLTVPSFWLYRRLVWRRTSPDGIVAEFVSFVTAVAVGTVASSLPIGVADRIWHPSGGVLVVVGLFGQGVVFLLRFFWFDRWTFRRRAAATGPGTP